MATQLDITAQETSFDLVAPQHEELVDRFYRRLLTTAPATRALFAHADMRAQKRALLGALVALRRSLRDLSSITPFLADLGARHARYGVCAEHYPLAGAALLGGWAEVAGGVAAGIHHRVGPRLSGGRPDHDRRRRAVRRRGVTTTAPLLLGSVDVGWSSTLQSVPVLAWCEGRVHSASRSATSARAVADVDEGARSGSPQAPGLINGRS